MTLRTYRRPRRALLRDLLAAALWLVIEGGKLLLEGAVFWLTIGVVAVVLYVFGPLPSP